MNQREFDVIYGHDHSNSDLHIAVLFLLMLFYIRVVAKLNGITYKTKRKSMQDKIHFVT